MAVSINLFNYLYKYFDGSKIYSTSLLNIIHKLFKRLIMLEIKSYQDIDGWLKCNEATALYLIARLLPPGSTIVEIGCWKGKSTYCLAKGLREDCQLITIDPFDASGDGENRQLYKEREGGRPLFDQFLDNMKKLNVLDRIKPFKGLSQKFVGQFPKIDLLFIDGDHSIEGCDFDFLNYSPYISTGGYIVFHDFDKSREDLGPTWVVNNRVLPSDDFHFLGNFDSLWIARKIHTFPHSIHSI